MHKIVIKLPFKNQCFVKTNLIVDLKYINYNFQVESCFLTSSIGGKKADDANRHKEQNARTPFFLHSLHFFQGSHPLFESLQKIQLFLAFSSENSFKTIANSVLTVPSSFFCSLFLLYSLMFGDISNQPR